MLCATIAGDTLLTTFQEREQAFEAKYAHDEEFRFLVTARRDKLFAQWAAERLGLSGQAKADLATSVLAVRDGAGHDEAVLKHVAAAFAGQRNSAKGPELAAALNHCAAQARQQLLDGPPRS